MFKRGSQAIIFVVCAVFLAHPQVNITGTISDSGTSLAVRGAVVTLAAAGGTAYSDSIGHYVLGGNTSVTEPAQARQCGPAIAGISGDRLCFTVANGPAAVTIEAFSASGRRIAVVVDRDCAKGEYAAPLPTDLIAPQVFFLRVQIGRSVSIVKAAAVDSRVMAGKGAPDASRSAVAEGSGKKAAGSDTLLAWAVGYGIAKLPISSLVGTYDIKLQRGVPPGSVQVVETSKPSEFLALKSSLTFATDDGSALPTVTVDTTQTFQTILGFGGAFTESSDYNLNKIGAPERAAIVRAYFSPFYGSGYTVCRTHIQSCDFTVASYCYDSMPGDYELNAFSIQHETTWMIPTIKEAMALPGADIKIFASPWSPPAWMKSNNSMLNGGTLLPTCCDAWALCFVKYIQEMGMNGVPIWGVTIQNEPEAVQPFESCNYTPASERDFLKNNLGPALASNKVDVKVMIYDHNKDHVVTWADTILGDTAAAKYVWGTAFHWYSGDQFENVGTTHANFPSKHLLATEETGGAGGSMFNWSIGQAYGHDIIGDLNNWADGWVDWNLVLDENGLPRHPPQGCPSSVDIDFSNNDLIYYNPAYYYIAHFSKYLRPGAVRLGCTSTLASLETTAFRNVNGRTVVVALNNTAAAIAFKIKQGTQIVKPTIPAYAIADYIY